VPDDVAALVTALSDCSTELTLVNTGPKPRTVIIRGGSFGEHRIDGLSFAGATHPAGGRDVSVNLAPKSGAEVTLAMTRFANRPTFAFPWDR
jgi:hypothetical protein